MEMTCINALTSLCICVTEHRGDLGRGFLSSSLKETSAKQGKALYRLQNIHIFCEHKQRGKYSKERSGVSVACFNREDHAYSASRLSKMEENNCFAV